MCSYLSHWLQSFGWSFGDTVHNNQITEYHIKHYVWCRFSISLYYCISASTSSFHHFSEPIVSFPELSLGLCIRPLLAEDDRQLGCGVCGGWWRAAFWSPHLAVWLHRLQTSHHCGGSCLLEHTPGRAPTQLLLAVTWPFGLCSTTPRHISPAALPPPTARWSKAQASAQE